MLRQTMQDAEVNVAYRWFLGYTMSRRLPHFATISYAFRHRFTAEVIEDVFRWILEGIEADREAHGEKALKKEDDDDTPSAPPEEKTIIESTTDPECGVFHKGEHKKCFAYEAHTQ